MLTSILLVLSQSCSKRKGEGRPAAVDTMKCYMMGPHRVGVARPKYWKFGTSLRGMRVLKLAASRNHMAAIVAPAIKDVP